MNELPEVEILLVEDDPHDAELTMHTLRKYGLAERVVHVDDGVAALEWLRRHADRTSDELRLVLLDLKLPKLDGLQVLQEIRSDKRLQHLPVVMMTSSRQERDVLRSYELGVNSYVVKPLEYDEFTRAVEALGSYWLTLNTTPTAGSDGRRTI
jgi:CheY-like chemotaxis protein